MFKPWKSSPGLWMRTLAEPGYLGKDSVPEGRHEGYTESDTDVVTSYPLSHMLKMS